MFKFPSFRKHASSEPTPSSSVAAAHPSRVVLLIDDDEAVISGLQRVLRTRRPQWKIVSALNGDAGLQIVATESVSAVVCDMSMPGMHGLDVLAQLQINHPDITRVALTGLDEERWKVARQDVAHSFLSKPCDPNALIAAIERGSNSLWALDGPTAIGHQRTMSSPRDLPPMPKSSEKNGDDEVSWQ